MEKLLFLAHRIPYPPNKGDKVRSYNLLKHLSKDYRVWLGAFVDDPKDWRHESDLREMVEELCLIGIRRSWRKLGSLVGLLNREALSIPYYRHRAIGRWVKKILKEQNIQRVIIYSSPMAQYVMGPSFQDLHRVMDFVDIDSEKWREYGRRQLWPLSWLYAREGEALLRFERKVASTFDASVFVTRDEADLFKSLAPEAADRVVHIHNGVDTQYFSPDLRFPNPYAEEERVLVFTGAMDYWANVDAITWFARETFPHVRRRVPQARLYIVGARPTAAVKRLHSAKNGIHVTGTVKDIRPYLAHARAAVAPLRVARGVQNKILEAMAMAKPVLATTAAMEGIEVEARLQPLIAEDPSILMERAVALLTSDNTSELGTWGRDLVSRNYSWTENLSRFETLLCRAPTSIGEASLARALTGR